jgi:hypothetical protein
MRLVFPFRKKTLRNKFARVYNENLFRGAVSKSGKGSDDDQTLELRKELPVLLQRLSVETLLDVPCGDLNWISKIKLNNVKYHGADIVDELIKDLVSKNQFSDKKFINLDATKDNIDKYDLILCRDLLVHLSTIDIFKVLNKFIESDSKYLLTTHFTKPRSYFDIPVNLPISWRPINLTMPPFNFPEPNFSIVENCTEADGEYLDKTLSLWKLQDIPLTLRFN